MLYCDKCGKRASDELIETVGETYSGDYFCSEECRNKQRTEDDQFR